MQFAGVLGALAFCALVVLGCVLAWRARDAPPGARWAVGILVTVAVLGTAGWALSPRTVTDGDRTYSCLDGPAIGWTAAAGDSARCVEVNREQLALSLALGAVAVGVGGGALAGLARRRALRSP
ncbi:hypothetical protein FHR80_001120 [Cellulomonas cellasea]|uniref:Uncharacterized protein n=1 Tax=Cellulomonas cellasea TaxID=43670 RepID=A0A7W4YA34_9CELL|nr:hypothetical protein [Cellulomonas cellasea]